jgi:hypothetical protein
MATLLELPFRKKDPGKNFAFAMLPLGRLAGASCRNPASSPRFLAGEGQGESLGCRGGRFRYLAGPVVAPASGAPTARESGRRGYRSRRAGRARLG